MKRAYLDTGALIALERRRHDMSLVHLTAIALGSSLVVPTPVLAEWWREGHREKQRERLLRSLVVESPDGRVAKLAGVAIGRVGASVVDALVMAAASVQGDTVYTSDVDDFERLLEVFPNVTIERA